MKIYILKTLSDIHNNYGGLDDVRVTVFTDVNKAQEEMKHFYESTKKYFIEEREYEEYELNMSYEDYYCYINNDNDYYSAEIEIHDLEV